ncbi:monovalent cation/H(+) antiporter subunit G [Streptomyces sp. Y1]|uniref:Monovalent cation/H(+) antiporter subunit G n=1 Tax=Streptomyces sp. Y1 TaxID=3238634 RepID=A0AB39TWA1_9ACTN
MTGRHAVAVALLCAGTATLLLAALALAVLPGPYLRLHALSAAGTLGAPLVALALAVDTGPGRAAVKLLVIGLLLATGGTVTTMAIGRTTVRGERRSTAGADR